MLPSTAFVDVARPSFVWMPRLFRSFTKVWIRHGKAAN
jgi:hypothetical protein